VTSAKPLSQAQLAAVDLAAREVESCPADDVCLVVAYKRARSALQAAGLWAETKKSMEAIEKLGATEKKKASRAAEESLEGCATCDQI
jgi:hypothetical protein